MMTKRMQIVPKYADASVLPGMLMHLSEMKGFMIADPAPDIRGWEAKVRDGRRVGTVDDLIVDTTELSPKYVEVKVDHEAMGTSDDTWVLVPISATHIRDNDDCVVIDWLPVAGIAGAPRSARTAPTREDERAIHDFFTQRKRSGEDESLDNVF